MAYSTGKTSAVLSTLTGVRSRPVAGVGRRKNCSAVRASVSSRSGQTATASGSDSSARQQRGNGGGQHLHFRRHEEQIFAGRGAGADVERLGAAEVARQPQHGDVGKLGIQLRAFVMGTAIHHQDFDGSAIVGSFERGQAAAQSGRAVVGKDQRRHLEAGGRSISCGCGSGSTATMGAALRASTLRLLATGMCGLGQRQDWSHLEVVIRQSAASRATLVGRDFAGIENVTGSLPVASQYTWLLLPVCTSTGT